jgi:arginyl-tRNA synthetase
MQPLKNNLNILFLKVIRELYPALSWPDQALLVTYATKKVFGHFQFNGALRMAKALKQSPQKIAQHLIDHLEHQQTDIHFKKVEVAGPGFINLWLDQATLEAYLTKQMKDQHVGVAQRKGRVVVDYSSPNIAKEMHVGHLRSTILGDAIANTLEFQGYQVLRFNHVGDWGTAFGMLIALLKKKHHPLVEDAHYPLVIRDLMTLYQQAKKLFDTDASFKKESQEYVVKLQQEDPECLQLWRAICHASEQSFQVIYALLKIDIVMRGESFYHTFLAGVIQDFSHQDLVQESHGAQCVFLAGFFGKNKEPLPLIIQKSDTGYNYATTDLAAIKYRVAHDKADSIIYVTDLGQKQHFDMIFAAALKVGYLKSLAQVKHVGFGLVLGEEGKKLKTRSGHAIPLRTLLDESIKQCKQLLQDRQRLLTEGALDQTAEALGINAVKYADLSCQRTQDYRFSYERMLRFDGNTANYILYAYVRIQSLLRKAGQTKQVFPLNTITIVLDEPGEQALALHLLKFPDVINALNQDWMMHHLTDFLYELANLFHQFFHECPIIGSAQQKNRLALCQYVGYLLGLGCQLLGLSLVEQM